MISWSPIPRGLRRLLRRSLGSARTTQLNTLGPQELSDSTWQWMVLVQVPANSTFTNSTACIVEWETKGFKVSGSVCDLSSRTEIQQLIETVSFVLDGRLNIFVPGVPLMYSLHKALLLESPSTFQCKFAKSIEEKRLHMSEVELKMLGMKKKNVPATEEARESFDANEAEGVQTTGSQAETKMKLERKRLQVKDSTQFKRKKPKGPNPLSCKKKSEKPNSRSAKEPKNDVETLRNRSRRRKRSRGSKKPKEANS